MTSQTEQKKITDHYSIITKYYKKFWDRSVAPAFHFGIYDKSKLGRREALSNTNQLIADLLQIKSGDKILDAGCGLGNSSIFLAKKYDVDVVGISIVPEHIQEANKNAKDLKNTRFLCADYTSTGFPDQSFDIVWALESVCHAGDKSAFLKESYRVLKSGGKLVVCDGFLSKPKEEFSGKDQKIISDFEKGFGHLKMVSLTEFRKDAENAGFRFIKFEDYTKETMPNFKLLRYGCKMAYPFIGMLSLVGLENTEMLNVLRTGWLHYYGAQSGMAKYGIFLFEK